MEKSGHMLLFATIAISMFLDGLDGTIVNVALPEIADSFGIGAGETSWVVTVYYLMMAGLILVFGRLCDKGAIKRILVTGMGIFTLGSLLCGLSPTLPALLACRAFQGIGAAMLASSAVMLGVKYLPREHLGTSMAVVVLGTSIGVAVGPSFGAVLTELISWHWIFFINVPIGVLAMILAHKAVPADNGLEKGDTDVIGSIMLFAGIVFGLFAIERIPSAGFNTTSVISLILCVVVLAAFVLYERNRASPVLDTRLFKNKNFDTAVLSYVMVNMGVMGMIYLFPFFIRKALEFDTLHSGLLLSLQAVSMIICCLFIGKMSDRLGDRIFAIIACGIMVIFAAVASTFTADVSVIVVAGSLLLCGMVWGIGGGPMGARIVDTLSENDKGSGSSMMSFVMYFSSALGTALMAGLFAMGSGEGSGSISGVDVGSFMDGFTFCMYVCVAIALLALLLSWLLKTDRGDAE